MEKKTTCNYYSVFISVFFFMIAVISIIELRSSAKMTVPEDDIPVDSTEYYAEAGSEKATQTANIVFPLNGNITSAYAWRVDPFYDAASGKEPTYEFHHGIDISAAQSRDIVSCADGRVIFVGNGEKYGNYIMIEHNGFTSLYAHCSSVIREVGDVVSAGESIAVAGSTGRATGPHLHFEIRTDGKTVDPLDYVGAVYTGVKCEN